MWIILARVLGTIGGDLVQLPHNEQEHPQPDLAAQRLTQPHLGRDGASITCLGNLFCCVTTLTVPDFLYI